MPSSVSHKTRGCTIDGYGPPNLLTEPSLVDRVNGHRYLFRVQQDCEDESRGCPTIYHSYLGFIAGRFHREYSHLDHLDPPSDTPSFWDQPVRLEALAPLKPDFDAVVDHLNWYSYKESPWISTSASLEWAAWDASRRVERGFTGVKIFVIDASEIVGGTEPTSRRRKFYAVELLERQGCERRDMRFSNLSQEVLVFASIPARAILSQLEITGTTWHSAIGRWPSLTPNENMQPPLPRFFFPFGESISPQTLPFGFPFRETWERLVVSARKYAQEDPLCPYCEGQKAAEQAMFWLGDLWESIFVEAVESSGARVNPGRTPHHTRVLAEEIAGWIHRHTPVAWQEVKRGIANYMDDLLPDGRLPGWPSVDPPSGRAESEDPLEELTESLAGMVL